MAVLWTDIIEPDELTGYVRAAQEDYEQAQGTLARYLPNRNVDGISVRFRKGRSGLIPEASYRAYDAAPRPGKNQSGKRVTLELPALTEELVVGEYDQLRTRGASDEAVRRDILSTAVRATRAIANRAERLRGIVINTGIATIPELGAADDFGRPADHNVLAGALWTDPDVDRIAFLEQLLDTYSTNTGAEPGVMLMTRRVYRALASGNQFRTLLVGGGSRPATEEQVRATLSGAGLPEIEIFNRRTFSGRVLDERKLFFLPAPVDPDDWEGTELGSTFWGQTLTSTHEDYNLAEAEQPGIVAGAYRGTKPPMIAEVVADSINLPVLANADLSLAAQVLN